MDGPEEKQPPGSGEAEASASFTREKVEQAMQEATQKAPNVPRRFRTAFIIYSAIRHKEIRKGMGESSKSQKVRD